MTIAVYRGRKTTQQNNNNFVTSDYIPGFKPRLLRSHQSKMFLAIQSYLSAYCLNLSSWFNRVAPGVVHLAYKQKAVCSKLSDFVFIF